MLFGHRILAVLLIAGCRAPEQRAELLPADKKSCATDAYFLELPSAGGYVLNSEQRDSAGVMRWIHEVLPKRSGTGRFVNVRVDSSRAGALTWLVPSIKGAGGEAYQGDPACRIEIPARAG